MKEPKETKLEVRELEQEILPPPSKTVTTTTDAPVSESARRTISAVLMNALRETRAER